MSTNPKRTGEGRAVPLWHYTTGLRAEEGLRMTAFAAVGVESR
jgi:hypothetical protein